MSYSTYTSVLTMLPGLPQTSTATGWSTTVSIVSSHLTRAYNLINTKLAKKYATPFTTTAIPPMCTSLEEDFACYYSMRSLFTRDAQNNSEWIVEHYDKAIKTLDELSDPSEEGMELLGSDGEPAPARVGATTGFQTTTDYAPTFELDEDTEWKVDSDRLDDIETLRDS